MDAAALAASIHTPTPPKRYLTEEECFERVRSIQRLKDEITKLAGHLNAANHRFLMLIAELDQRKGWSDGATQSCAHWLNWKCGIDMGAAREKVRVAHALQRLPKISAAMERGELSYSKVRALTRAACEGTEDYFLSIAQHGTAHHVETLVRHYRRALESEELSREARQRANRNLRFFYDLDDRQRKPHLRRQGKPDVKEAERCRQGKPIGRVRGFADGRPRIRSSCRGTLARSALTMPIG